MIDRISLLLKTKNLSPSLFADEIQVQRSSVSHVLSGRNKPSLDFVLKILSTYPEVSSEWLMFGKGQMLKQADKKEEIIEQEKQVVEMPIKTEKFEKDKKGSAPSYPVVNEKQDIQSGEIEKIVVFNKDGTYKEYTPK